MSIETKYVPVLSLPLTFKITYRALCGTKEVTKTVLNCITEPSLSGTVISDNKISADIPIVMSFNEAPRIVNITHSVKSNTFQFRANNRTYNILLIDGKNPIEFSNPNF